MQPLMPNSPTVIKSVIAYDLLMLQHFRSIVNDSCRFKPDSDGVGVDGEISISSWSETLPFVRENSHSIYTSWNGEIVRIDIRYDVQYGDLRDTYVKNSHMRHWMYSSWSRTCPLLFHWRKCDWLLSALLVSRNSYAPRHMLSRHTNVASTALRQFVTAVATQSSHFQSERRLNTN